jgi:predicted Zn-dependent peptidase
LIQEHDANHHEYERTTIENCHYNSFRDHQLGQPIRGDADRVQLLTPDVLHAYRSANYFGDNIVVVGTGAVSHDQFVD